MHALLPPEQTSACPLPPQYLQLFLVYNRGLLQIAKDVMYFVELLS